LKRALSILLIAFSLSLLQAADLPDEVILIDPRVIDATLAQREQWIIEQAKGPTYREQMFSDEYEWLLTSDSIRAKEAKQLAYLFFASTGAMGGYFEDPILVGSSYKITFHSELGPTEAFPVFVDVKTGLTWQEGQKQKIDTLALIRLFTKHRKSEETKPPTPPSRS